MSNGIPKGFTPWSGGTRPVDPGTTVEYVMDHGGRYRGVAKVLHWGREQGNHIIAYRVVEEEKPAVEIPEGFTPWAGGECPVDKGRGYRSCCVMATNLCFMGVRFGGPA